MATDGTFDEPDSADSFTISFATGPRYDLDEIRRRREAFMPDGEHAWVISAVYAIEDPERSMDSMNLDGDNFVGITAISCLLCNTEYRVEIRHHKCPQAVIGG